MWSGWRWFCDNAAGIVRTREGDWHGVGAGKIIDIRQASDAAGAVMRVAPGGRHGVEASKMYR